MNESIPSETIVYPSNAFLLFRNLQLQGEKSRPKVGACGSRVLSLSTRSTQNLTLASTNYINLWRKKALVIAKFPKKILPFNRRDSFIAFFFSVRGFDY